MTNKQRRSYDNLIVLCTTHHIETNDETKYTVQTLKEMRENHQASMESKLEAGGILAAHPSSLVEVIRLISSQEFWRPETVDGPSDGFPIADKISYNKVVRFKPLIEEYRVYQGKLTRIYAQLEEQGSYRKQQLLQNIRGLYLEAKGTVLHNDQSLAGIQANADNLISYVQNRLFDLINGGGDRQFREIPIEAINVAISVIVVDAFMRCKILEEPLAYDN